MGGRGPSHTPNAMAVTPDVCALLDAEVGGDIGALQGALASLSAAAAAGERNTQANDGSGGGCGGGDGGGVPNDVGAVSDELLATLRSVDQRHATVLKKISEFDGTFGDVA